MTLIQEFKSWLKRDLGSKDVVHDQSMQSSSEYRIFLYTETNRYSIVAKQHDGKAPKGQQDDGGYLGCIAKSRKSRTGEDWFRGNDLPDGLLTEETWREILLGIIRYELQTICREDLKVMAA